ASRSGLCGSPNIPPLHIVARKVFAHFLLTIFGVRRAPRAPLPPKGRVSEPQQAEPAEKRAQENRGVGGARATDLSLTGTGAVLLEIMRRAMRPAQRCQSLRGPREPSAAPLVFSALRSPGSLHSL
ncbi:hypothetical protein Z043_104248, partial [Scleropages formosus]